MNSFHFKSSESYMSKEIWDESKEVNFNHVTRLLRLNHSFKICFNCFFPICSYYESQYSPHTFKWPQYLYFHCRLHVSFLCLCSNDIPSLSFEVLYLSSICFEDKYRPLSNAWMLIHFCFFSTVILKNISKMIIHFIKLVFKSFILIGKSTNGTIFV